MGDLDPWGDDVTTRAPLGRAGWVARYVDRHGNLRWPGNGGAMPGPSLSSRTSRCSLRHSRQGWQFLRISSPDDSTPPGFDVLEEPDFSADLVIHGDPPVRLGDLLNRRKALEMANALSVPFDDLVASFRDPHGLPAFPQN